MIPILLALAGLALSPPVSPDPKPMPKAATAKAVRGKAAARKPAAAPAPKILPSDDAARVAGWVAASKDNRALPYAIVDKKNAALFLFNGKGKQLAAVPVLIGIAPGDDATAGVGAKSLSEIGPAEKTTPAGRFLAKFGLAAGNTKVLWVDYFTSVALHPIPPGSPKKERRRERLLSPRTDDNRITFGCINVPSAFYSKTVRPAFQRKGGYVYVMPDTKPLEAVFPGLLAQPSG